MATRWAYDIFSVIAYLLLAHKQLDHVVRLVRRLHSGRSGFFIHIDKKTDRSRWEPELAALAKLPRVRFIEPHRCPWGGFGLVKATTSGIATALASDLPWQHLMLLSGQDYPIQPVGSIEKFFTEHAGESFMEHFPLPRADWHDGGLGRIQDWHSRVGVVHLRFPTSAIGVKRSIPGGLRPFQGGQCFTISREAALYLRDFVSENPGFVRFFRFTNNPDESFFQTILLNSPLAPAVVNDDLRFEKWAGSDWHPAILRTSDLEDLMASDKLVAKKFDPSVDSEILDRIDCDILGSSPG